MAGEDRLIDEQAVRVLYAKANAAENRVLQLQDHPLTTDFAWVEREVVALIADINLLATILGNHIQGVLDARANETHSE